MFSNIGMCNIGQRCIGRTLYTWRVIFLVLQQILCLAEQIKFTEDVENAIKDHSLHQIETQLVAKLERYTSVDTSSEDPGNSGMETELSAGVCHECFVITNLSFSDLWYT